MDNPTPLMFTDMHHWGRPLPPPSPAEPLDEEAAEAEKREREYLLRRTVVRYFKLLTRPHHDIDFATISHERLAREVPLDNGRHKFKSLDAGLGLLGALATETIRNILSAVDLKTLTNFRSVNRYARLAVDNMAKYNIIVEQAPGVLRHALAIGAASWISCDGLHELLTTQSCSRCTDYGSYIYLLTWERVCFHCTSFYRDFFPVSPSRAAEKYGLDAEQVAGLRTVHSLPGRYSYASNYLRDRYLLVDAREALAAGIQRHGSPEKMQQFVADSWVKKLRRCGRTVAEIRKVVSVQANEPACPPYTDVRDTHGSNPKRFMALVSAPWLDELGTADWGFFCYGCHTKRAMFQPRRTLFLRETFVDHVRSCNSAQKEVDRLAVETAHEREGAAIGGRTEGEDVMVKISDLTMSTP